MAIETTPKFKNNSKNIKVGNTIQFYRKGYLYEGLVNIIREMTVVVSVDPTSVPKDLAFENNLTVVNHGNYIIKNQKQLQPIVS